MINEIELTNPESFVGSFTVKLKSVGNPDYGQYTPISEPESIVADSLQAVGREIRRYKSEWNLGGGNWCNPVIYHNGKPLCRVSYNGRLWAVNKELCAS